MQRASTTVVALVGERAATVLSQLGEPVNVRVAVVDADLPPLERAARVGAIASGAHIPFLIHDADPLASVADAWVRRFDGAGPAGELEVAVAETRARWRAGAFDLPDYYLVLNAAAMEPTRRHWFLGVLHGAAPARVVPVPGTPGAVLTAMGTFPSARWWGPLDDLLEGIEVAPDRAGLPGSAAVRRP